MSHMFRQVDRKTLFLLPPSMDDWLTEGHLARFVVEIVEQLDLTTIKAAYAGRGSKAHHPEMLLALLFYGYATGVFSSRRPRRYPDDHALHTHQDEPGERHPEPREMSPTRYTKTTHHFFPL